jgi:hypothetical protein
LREPDSIRFLGDFMLTLNRGEIRNLSQIVIRPGLKHARHSQPYGAAGAEEAEDRVQGG